VRILEKTFSAACQSAAGPFAGNLGNWLNVLSHRKVDINSIVGM
jgi:hypothetical protein